MKVLNKVVVFFTVFVIVLKISAVDAIAVLGYLTPYPRLSNLYFLSISSVPDENSTNTLDETFYTSNPYGIGLSDMRLKAKKKHHRGKVEIRFQQKGYTDGTTLTIDGKKITNGISYESESGYIPETGRFGVIAWKDKYTAYNLDDAVTESEIKWTSYIYSNINY